MCPVALRVRDVVGREVHLANVSETVNGAIRAMVDKGSWSLVVTRDGLPVGVVTERDVIRRCYVKGLDPSRSKLEAVVSGPIITIGPDSPLGDAMTLKTEKKIRPVYAVENGKIVGRFAQTDAFRQMLDVLFSLSAVA